MVPRNSAGGKSGSFCPAGSSFLSDVTRVVEHGPSARSELDLDQLISRSHPVLSDPSPPPVLLGVALHLFFVVGRKKQPATEARGNVLSERARGGGGGVLERRDALDPRSQARPSSYDHRPSHPYIQCRDGVASRVFTDQADIARAKREAP